MANSTLNEFHVACIFRVQGRDAKDLKDTLAANGIMVRYYSSPEVLAGCIRISVGKPEQVRTIYLISYWASPHKQMHPL